MNSKVSNLISQKKAGGYRFESRQNTVAGPGQGRDCLSLLTKEKNVSFNTKLKNSPKLLYKETEYP